jgi:hypothetical protein
MACRIDGYFVSIGSDIEFRHTPGMLLIIDLGNSEPETIRRYFAEGTEAYLSYSSKVNAG